MTSPKSHLLRALEKFGAAKIHPSVKSWVERGEAIGGPLAIGTPSEVLEHVLPCSKLSRRAPEGPLPAIVAGEHGGVPLLVVIETGKVISLHLDATLFEVADEIVDGARTPATFAKALAREGAALTFDELLGVARAVEGWPSIASDGRSSASRIRAIAAGLGWTVQKLAEVDAEGQHPRLEFLRLDEGELASVVEVDGRLAKAARGAATVVDLSGCGLDAWPTLGANVQSLDLTNNPALPWAEGVERLAACKKLRELRVDGLSAKTLSSLRKGLPGVSVRQEGDDAEAKPKAKGASSGVTKVDLAGRDLRELPAEVAGCTSAKIVDLSGNPKLDWAAACEVLATLPELEEVRFAGCGLKAPPPGLEKLVNLRRIELGRGRPYGGEENRMEALAPRVALLRALPRLEHLAFGRFGEEGHDDVGDADLERLREVGPPVLPRLESVSVEHSPKAGSMTWLADWLSRLPALRSLTVTSKGGSVAPLARLGSLRELRLLVSLVSSDVHQDEVLAAMPNLEVLRLRWDTLRFARPNGAAVGLPEAIRAMRGLRELDVSWSEKSSDRPCGELPDWLAELPLERLRCDAEGAAARTVPRVVGKLTGLRSLELRGAGTPSDGAHLGALTKLERLDLRFKTNGRMAEGDDLPTSLRELVTNAVPSNLGRLTQLRRLEIQASQLELGDVAALASLRSLETLVSVGCEGATLGSLPALRSLKFSGNIEEQPAVETLDITGIRPFPKRMPVVREVSWSAYGEGAWKAGVARLAGYPTLRKLTLHYFHPDDRKLTDDFAKLEQLEQLVLAGTCFSDAKSVARLRKMLPRCQVKVVG